MFRPRAHNHDLSSRVAIDSLPSNCTELLNCTDLHQRVRKMPVINQTTLKRLTVGSEELLIELAEKFAQMLPLLRKGLTFGIENRFPKLVKSSARQIKNHARYFGAETLEQLAIEMVGGADTEDTASLQALQLKLNDGIDELLGELREMTQRPLPTG